MLFERQRALIALLDALGGHATNLDFQKFLFLWCRELGVSAPYNFIPYRFGAFSFTSYADRKKLIERGYLDNDEKIWRLTEIGRNAIRKNAGLRQDARFFIAPYADLQGDELVALTYRLYPWFATRSEISSRVLAGDEASLARIEAARRVSVQPGVVTIGYEGRSFESYLELLLLAGVSVLCDVRRNPISRRYGFSKSSLSRGCELIGIRYEHFPELGIASVERKGLDTQADYDVLFENYRRNSLPLQENALARIHALVADGRRVALTCFEELPKKCHRHCIADVLERVYGSPFTPTHL